MPRALVWGAQFEQLFFSINPSKTKEQHPTGLLFVSKEDSNLARAPPRNAPTGAFEFRFYRSIKSMQNKEQHPIRCCSWCVKEEFEQPVPRALAPPRNAPPGRLKSSSNSPCAPETPTGAFIQLLFFP